MKNKNITLVAILFTISVFMAFANGPAPQTIVDTDQIIDGAVTILKTDGVAANDLSNVTPATGRSALGLGTVSTVNSPVPVANGGTGATTAATARTNLGVTYGATAGTVCQGNDSRLSDARTPTAHGHSGEEVTSGTVADARIDAAICRDSELTTHGNLTAAHGVTGAVVGTTNTQTLTNKTMGSGCAWGGTAVPVANGGTGATTAAAGLAALGGASLNGSSTVNFAANGLSAEGFVRMGAGNTPVKMKVLTGTTAAVEGGVATAPHGLTLSKVVSCTVFLNVGSIIWPSAISPSAGYSTSFYLDGTNITVTNSATDSENSLSTEFIATIWYKE